jgi:hypothetical protein
LVEVLDESAAIIDLSIFLEILQACGEVALNRNSFLETSGLHISGHVACEPTRWNATNSDRTNDQLALDSNVLELQVKYIRTAVNLVGGGNLFRMYRTAVQSSSTEEAELWNQLAVD